MLRLNKKFGFLPVLLALILFTAGCASTSIPLTGNQVQAATAVPSNAAVTPSSASNPSTALRDSSSKSGSSGGLVVKIDPQNSVADYRVREQLAKRSLPSDAVGKTNQISGQVVIKPDGTIDTANSKFTVDLASLQTDSGMRDNYVRRNILETSQYPTATFVPTQVSGLAWPLPQSGPVAFKLTGDLTVHGVTKPVTWDVSGNIQNGHTGQASGLAKTSFKFEDFNLQEPQVPVVLSVVDNITLEVTVALQAGG